MAPKNKDVPIVIYCQTGIRASWALVALQGLGYTNVINGHVPCYAAHLYSRRCYFWFDAILMRFWRSIGGAESHVRMLQNATESDSGSDRALNNVDDSGNIQMRLLLGEMQVGPEVSKLHGRTARNACPNWLPCYIFAGQGRDQKARCAGSVSGSLNYDTS